MIPFQENAFSVSLSSARGNLVKLDLLTATILKIMY